MIDSERPLTSLESYSSMDPSHTDDDEKIPIYFDSKNSSFLLQERKNILVELLQLAIYVICSRSRSVRVFLRQALRRVIETRSNVLGSSHF